KRHIPNDHIFLRRIGTLFWRSNDQLAAGQTFAEIVIAVSPKLDGQSFGDKCPEALPSCSGTVNLISVILHAFRAASGNLRPKHGPEGPVRIFDMYIYFSWHPFFQFL